LLLAHWLDGLVTHTHTHTHRDRERERERKILVYRHRNRQCSVLLLVCCMLTDGWVYLNSTSQGCQKV